MRAQSPPEVRMERTILSQASRIASQKELPQSPKKAGKNPTSPPEFDA